MSTSLPKISLWGRIVSLLAPRSCAVCGTRLEPHEDIVCACCNLHLPRTNYAVDPYDNEMAQLFWGRVPVERCAALLHYQAAAPASALLYKLKYGNRPDLGIELGRLMVSSKASTSLYQCPWHDSGCGKEAIIRARCWRKASHKSLV